MNDVATQILSLIKANPEWAIFVVGLTGFGESFVFLSLLFPGTAVLIASGTLISEGVLTLLPTVVAGIAATRCHIGSARNLDLVFQKYGLSKDILSASRAA
jgi:membrane protein DedA with SNARE-associated domain